MWGNGDHPHTSLDQVFICALPSLGLPPNVKIPMEIIPWWKNPVLLRDDAIVHVVPHWECTEGRNVCVWCKDTRLWLNEPHDRAHSCELMWLVQSLCAASGLWGKVEALWVVIWGHGLVPFSLTVANVLWALLLQNYVPASFFFFFLLFVPVLLVLLTASR